MLEFTRINTALGYFNRNGKSVIDYMLFDPNCYNMITDFAIAPKLVESDHCPIEYGLEIEPIHMNP